MIHLIYKRFDLKSNYFAYVKSNNFAFEFKSVASIFTQVNRLKGLNQDERLEVYTKLFDLIDSEQTDDIPKTQLDEFYNSVPEIRVACYFQKLNYYFEYLSYKDMEKDATLYLERLVNEGMKLLDGNFNKATKSDIANELKMMLESSFIDLSSDKNSFKIDVNYLVGFILKDNLSVKFYEKFYSCAHEYKVRNNLIEYDKKSNFKLKELANNSSSNFKIFSVVKFMIIVFLILNSLLIMFVF